MKKELKIDRAVYLVDDITKTYEFLRRNADWKKLNTAENVKNKQRINGYKRILSDKPIKKYRS